MAQRKIVRGVRLGTTTYTPGKEDELAKVLAAEEAARLSEKGYLEGTWATSAPATKSKDTNDADDLESLTVAELKDKARDAEVPNFSTMNKSELVDALSK